MRNVSMPDNLRLLTWLLFSEILAIFEILFEMRKLFKEQILPNTASIFKALNFQYQWFEPSITIQYISNVISTKT